MRRATAQVVLSALLPAILALSVFGQPCIRCTDCPDRNDECMRSCKTVCPDNNQPQFTAAPTPAPTHPVINLARCRRLGVAYGQQDVVGQACSATRRYCIIGPRPRPLMTGTRPCAKLAYGVCVGVALNRWPASCGVNTTQPGLCSSGRWRDIYTFAITELCSRRARTILN